MLLVSSRKDLDFLHEAKAATRKGDGKAVAPASLSELPALSIKPAPSRLPPPSGRQRPDAEQRGTILRARAASVHRAEKEKVELRNKALFGAPGGPGQALAAHTAGILATPRRPSKAMRGSQLPSLSATMPVQPVHAPLGKQEVPMAVRMRGLWRSADLVCCEMEDIRADLADLKAKRGTVCA